MVVVGSPKSRALGFDLARLGFGTSDLDNSLSILKYDQQSNRLNKEHKPLHPIRNSWKSSDNTQFKFVLENFRHPLNFQQIYSWKLLMIVQLTVNFFL